MLHREAILVLYLLKIGPVRVENRIIGCGQSRARQLVSRPSNHGKMLALNSGLI